MDIKFWTPVLVSVVLAAGSVQAMADSNWQYDEDSQTIVFSYSGGPVSQSQTTDETTEHTGGWFYDEGSDSIVHNGEGSRAKYIRSNVANEPTFDFQLAYLDL